MSGFLDGYRAGKSKRSEVVLRDWFAGMALGGMHDRIHLLPYKDMARYAYRIADAMMEARSEKG